MSFIKAVLLGAILTFVVSAAVRGAKGTGGVLAVHQLQLSGYDIAWSWPLFVAASGLALGILTIMK